MVTALSGTASSNRSTRSEAVVLTTAAWMLVVSGGRGGGVFGGGVPIGWMTGMLVIGLVGGSTLNVRVGTLQTVPVGLTLATMTVSVLPGTGRATFWS